MARRRRGGGTRVDEATPLASLRVSRHAAERFRLHHPDADDDAVRRAWRDGIELDPVTAQFLVGRPHSRAGSLYRLCADRRGVLVVVRAWDAILPEAVVTYLRFQQSQEDFAWKHWPDESQALTGVRQAWGRR